MKNLSTTITDAYRPGRIKQANLNTITTNDYNASKITSTNKHDDPWMEIIRSITTNDPIERELIILNVRRAATAETITKTPSHDVVELDKLYNILNNIELDIYKILKST